MGSGDRPSYEIMTCSRLSRSISRSLSSHHPKPLHSTRLVSRQSAMEVSSVHWPARKWKGPPPIISLSGSKPPPWTKLDRVPTAPPTARPRRQPRKRSCWSICVLSRGLPNRQLVAGGGGIDPFRLSGLFRLFGLFRLSVPSGLFGLFRPCSIFREDLASEGSLPPPSVGLSLASAKLGMTKIG